MALPDSLTVEKPETRNGLVAILKEMRADPLIFMSAGEASGDHYGAELMAKLREVLPDARFTGLGGVGMEAAGQQRVVRAEDVAVMGVTEILRHIPRILRSYRRLVRSIRRERPDVAVLIDFPDVNFRLAKHLKRMGVPVLWFVSPQLWAWKRRRLRWVQARVDTMLTIFPFEEEFYRARGVRAEFVGHPLAEALLPTISREEFGAKYDIDPAKPWIALLPGSRTSELKQNLIPMLHAAARLGTAYEYILPVAPTLSGDSIRNLSLSEGKVSFKMCREAAAAILHSRASVVASGTATVQAAVLGTPFVAVYRVSRTTFTLAKRLVRYPPELSAQIDEAGNLPIAMPNLIAGRRVVPELLQERFTAEDIVRELRPLLEDGPEREAQIAGLAEIRRSLVHPDGGSAMDRLRDAVVDALRRTDRSSGVPSDASNV